MQSEALRRVDAVLGNRVTPAIDDNGFKLGIHGHQSLSRQKARQRLAAEDDGGRGGGDPMELLGMTEVEKPALTVLLHRFLLPEDKRDSKLADEAEHQLQKPLSVLDQRLATAGYLIGETFTVADLNVASVLSWARMGGVALSAFPNMDQWLAGCLRGQLR
jgi:glutathione S-transferase